MNQPKIALLIRRAVLIAGIAGTLACWLYAFMVLGGVSYGASLRPEWRNWLVLLLYGFGPAGIATLAIGRAAFWPAGVWRIRSEWLALAPFALLAFGVTAIQHAVWPV